MKTFAFALFILLSSSTFAQNALTDNALTRTNKRLGITDSREEEPRIKYGKPHAPDYSQNSGRSHPLDTTQYLHGLSGEWLGYTVKERGQTHIYGTNGAWIGTVGK